MRTKSILACITVIAGTIGAGSAFAQSAQSSADIVNGSFGSMTCGDFSALSHGQQAGLTKEAKSDAPATSLTSNSGLGNSNGNSGPGSSANANGGYDGALGLGAPLNSGQLIAACQAVPASSTLQDAFSKFTSGGQTSSDSSLR